MTAITSAPPLEQLAPGVKSRVRDGDLDGPRTAWFAVGGVALVASLVGWAVDAEQFLFSYHVVYMFTLAIVLGALFFVMLQHVTRAGWSVVVRRVAENLAGVMPLMAIGFIPIAVGHATLFHHWVHAVTEPGQPGYDPVLAQKAPYLNVPFFFARAVLYFAVWIALARYFRRTSLVQDQNGDPELTLKMARRAAPGILVFAITTTFAAWDWIMSMDPHWFSTIFGLTYFAGGVMSLLAMLTLITLWLARRGYLKEVVSVEHYHDIGKLLFAFTMFWVYVNFSQYMLIWYANLPEETLWYQDRIYGGWDDIGTFLILGHFIVPFVFLVSRITKRNRVTLTAASVFLLAMHWLDMQFLIMPEMPHGPDGPRGLHVTWLDATTMVGVVGLLVAFTLHNIIKSPLLPERDPRLTESLRFENV